MGCSKCPCYMPPLWLLLGSSRERTQAGRVKYPVYCNGLIMNTARVFSGDLLSVCVSVLMAGLTVAHWLLNEQQAESLHQPRCPIRLGQVRLLEPAIIRTHSNTINCSKEQIQMYDPCVIPSWIPPIRCCQTGCSPYRTPPTTLQNTYHSSCHNRLG